MMRDKQENRVLEEAEQVLLSIKEQEATDVLFDTAWELLVRAFALDEPDDESKAYLLPLFAALANMHPIDETCALCFDLGRAYEKDYKNERG